jgi:hypothetical protein
MSKYLGLISILILVITGFIYYSLLGKMIPEFWVYSILFIGFFASILFCWFSPSGFWKKVSATILIGLPICFIVVVVLIGLSGL